MKVDSLKRFKLNLGQIGYFFKLVTELVKSGKDYEVNITEWSDKRTLSANAQQAVWYKQISIHYGVDIVEAKNMSKLDFALPILLGDFNYGCRISEVLDGFNFWDLPREQQLRAMPLFAMTSIMTTKQSNLYRDQLAIYWNRHGLELKYKSEQSASCYKLN